MTRPTFKNEWNVTTVIALMLFVATVVGWGQSYGRFSQRVDVLEREATAWRENHLQFHRERAQDNTATDTRLDERLKHLESQARSIDNLTYRMTVQEQGTTNLTAAVAELRQIINDVTGDIRLIREVVTRMEDRSEGPKR